MKYIKSYFYNIVHNRAGIILLIGIIAVLVIFAITSKSNDYGPNWYLELTDRNDILKEQLSNPNTTPYFQERFESELELNNYFLLNNKNPNTFKFWDFIYKQIDLLIFCSLAIFCLIIFFQENFRDILTFKRIEKVFWSRLSAYIILYLIMVAVVLGASFIIGLFFWPSSVVNIYEISFNNGALIETSYIKLIFIKLVLMALTSISFIGVVYCIHSLVNTPISILLISLFFILGFYITNRLEEISLIFRYSYFVNLNLLTYMEGKTTTISGFTLLESILKMIFYFVIFNFLTSKAFNFINRNSY